MTITKINLINNNTRISIDNISDHIPEFDGRAQESPRVRGSPHVK